jgi:L-lactate dehydrogenase complex protein LldG
MSARDAILGRLRAAQVSALPAPAAWTPPTTSAEDPTALAERMVGHLEAAHAHVVLTTESGWRDELKHFCHERKIGALMLPATGIDLDAWDGGPTLSRFDTPIETHKNVLFQSIDAGITWADCAIAETGTLVLRAAPDNPRTLSLVPPIHICLIYRSRIYATLPAAMAAEGWAGALPSNLICVSGPSKTADIQQTLAYGAHGPKEMLVLIIEGSAA